MNHCQSGNSSAIPEEYRGVAEALFPCGDMPADTQGFAEALGIGAEYGRLITVRANAEKLREFQGHFQNNLDLLIQKTWVETADAVRKDQLQDDVVPLVNLIEQGNFLGALEKFGAVIEELAYLLFGKQSCEDDFSEYTFRIDPQIGLFWWYGTRLGSLKKIYKKDMPGDDTLWAILLIGLCYLTNF